MPNEGKFVLGLEEPEYPPRIHEPDHEKHDAFNRFMVKLTVIILLCMGIILILGIMLEFPLSFIPAGIIALLIIKRKRAKHRHKNPIPVKGIPQGKPRAGQPTHPQRRRNPSNLRQSGFPKR